MCHKAATWQVAEEASVSAALSLPELTDRLFTPWDVLLPAVVHGCLVAGMTHLPYQLCIHGAEGAVQHLIAAVSPTQVPRNQAEYILLKLAKL